MGNKINRISPQIHRLLRNNPLPFGNRPGYELITESIRAEETGKGLLRKEKAGRSLPFSL